MTKIIPIVSFPKSGNTWLRFIIANLFKREINQKVNFKNINEYSCTSFNEIATIKSSLLKKGSPLFVKQHSNFYNYENYHFKKAIYIYRNGFDVIKSYKLFTDAQQPGLYKNYDQFIKCYWTYCGHWGDHIKSWKYDANKDLEVFSISYEDLKRDTFSTVKSIAKFLEVEFSDQHIRNAVQVSSKDNMKLLSGSKEFMKSKKEDFHFVRSAKVGDHKGIDEEIKQLFLSHDLNYEMMIKLGFISNKSILRKYQTDKFHSQLRCKLFRYKHILNK